MMNQPFRLCKRHFQKAVCGDLKKHFKVIFRGADKAYSSMDFEGIGFINLDSFINSFAC